MPRWEKPAEACLSLSEDWDIGDEEHAINLQTLA
jgi:hypothetical protein